MSEPRVAALVCEGQTDVPVLRAFLEAVWPELEDVRCVQPELDETDRAKGPAGWTQVRAWCERHAGDLGDVLEPDVGDPIDLLLVAVDLDIAIEAGIADPPSRAAGAYEAPRLRETISSWLGPRTAALPSAIMIATPVRALEAWIIAALFPREPAPERIQHPAQWLVAKRKLRVSPTDGEPWKELHVYRDDFAPKVASKVARVRERCPEAERMASLVERRMAALGVASPGS